MSDDGEEEEFMKPKAKKQKIIELVKGLYLESVNRNMLDFDFEKLCSISLTNLNVYGCLTCGKYFQGFFM
jgi:U4/U6.U5 tri-snRNP-associated protein 2